VQQKLYDAVAANNSSSVQQLLEQGADVNYRKPVLHKSVQAIAGREWAPLHQAVYNNHVRITSLLLRYRANVGIQDQRGNTPMHWAALLGHSACLQELLALDPLVVHVANENGATPLHAAITGNSSSSMSAIGAPPTDDDAAELLAPLGQQQQQSTSTSTTTPSSKSKGRSKTKPPNPVTTSDTTATATATGTTTDATIDTSMMLSASKPRITASGSSNSSACVEPLVLAGAFLNAPCARGWTAVHHAAFSDDQPMLCFLIEQRASVTLRDCDGDTALHKAACSNLSSCIAPLIGFRASIDAQNNHGETPLHVAIRRGNQATAFELLVRFHASYTVPTNRGYTPLHYAVSAGLVGMVNYMLDTSPQPLLAAVNQPTLDGTTPLHLAAAALGSPSSSDSTEKRGPARIQHLGSTMINMHIGSKSHLQFELTSTIRELPRTEVAIDLIHLLLNKEADPLLYNNDHDSPIHLVSYHGATSILELMLAKYTTSMRQKLGTFSVSEASSHTAYSPPSSFANSFALMRPPSPSGTQQQQQQQQQQYSLSTSPPLLSSPTPVPLANPSSLLSGGHLSTIATAPTSSCSSTTSSSPAPLDLSDPNIWPAMSPLHSACTGGRLSCAAVLLEHGVSVNVLDDRGRTPLMYAIAAGYLEVLQWLIRKGADVTTVDRFGNTILHFCSPENDNEQCVFLVGLLANSPENKHILTAANHAGDTPLHHATRRGNYSMVAALMSQSVRCNSSGWRGRTPLHLAVKHSHLSLVTRLLTCNADPNAADQDGRTALHFAAISDCQDSIRALFSAFADASIADTVDRKTPLHYAAALGHQRAALALIVLFGTTQLNSASGTRCTPLHFASYHGSLATVRMLLEKRADVNHENEEGCTALHFAVNGGNTRIAETLIQAGASVNALDARGISPLQRSLLAPHSDCTELLLQHSAKVNHADANLETPLLWAISSGSRQSVGMLLSAGAYLRAESRECQTPLQLTAKLGLVDCMEQLLRRGVTPIERSSSGEYPIHAAARYGRIECLSLLLPDTSGVHCDEQRERYLELRDAAGNTAMHVAAQHNQYDFVHQLLDYGADIQALNVHNETPLHLAAQFGSLDSLALLLDARADVDAIDCDGGSSLLSAVTNGHIHCAKSLVKNGARCNQRDAAGETPLFGVIRHLPLATLSDSLTPTRNQPLRQNARANVRLGFVQILIDANASVDASNNARETPLHIAAQVSSAACVSVLLAAGADAQAQSLTGDTPLHAAARFASSCVSELIRTLVSHRCNVEATNCLGQTPLHVATIHDNRSCVMALLDANAQVNATSNAGDTAMHYCAQYNHHHLMRTLSQYNGLPSAPNETCDTPLHIAAKYGSMEACDTLLRLGAKSMRGNTGLYPLHYAAELGDAATPILLAAHYTNDLSSEHCLRNVVNCRESIAQQTPLHVAASLGHTDFCQALLRCSAEPQLSNSLGQTPIELGIASPTSSCRRLFLSCIEPTRVSKAFALVYIRALAKFQSADTLSEAFETLQRCAWYDTDDGDVAILREIAAVDVALCVPLITNSQRLASQSLHLACRMDNVQLLQRLLESPFRPEIESVFGPKNRTALHEAILHNSRQCIDVLVSMGASMDATDADGNSAFQLAEVATYRPSGPSDPSDPGD
jgi:ankyrin repeat protein